MKIIEPSAVFSPTNNHKDKKKNIRTEQNGGPYGWNQPAEFCNSFLEGTNKVQCNKYNHLTITIQSIPMVNRLSVLQKQPLIY